MVSDVVGIEESEVVSIELKVMLNDCDNDDVS